MVQSAEALGTYGTSQSHTDSCILQVTSFDNSVMSSGQSGLFILQQPWLAVRASD